MRLYSGVTKDLIDDATHNRVAAKLSDAFFKEFRYPPPPSEINSWRNSIRAITQVFEKGRLLENGVILELQLPLTSKRLDCLLTGRNEDSQPNAVIVELKQWEKCHAASGQNEVATFIGGKLRDLLHPSAQVGQYKMYMEDCHPAFDEPDGLRLHACSYLHNYDRDASDPIFSEKFSTLLTAYPLFTGDDVGELTSFLNSKISNGDCGELLRDVEQSSYRANKKLLNHVAAVINGKPEYILLDEQLVVFDSVLAAALARKQNKKKTVVIVKGGPGTGKSVIALRLLGALSQEGLNTHYVTGSRAFTQTVRKIVGTRAAAQIRYFNGYLGADYDCVDVLVCDEAHRIRITSNSRFTPAKNRSKIPQVDELIKAGRTLVFLLDDNQVVRPGEIGSADYIKQRAVSNDCEILEYKLEAQFRCSGSEGFVNWINNTLGVERTANVLWNSEEQFEFKVFDSPEALELAIRQRTQQGPSARMTAGFCWPWSDPNADGTLVNDIVIGGFRPTMEREIRRRAFSTGDST